MKFRLILSGMTAFGALLGCAQPTPEFEPQTFVPRREILAASRYQEGINYYQSGRYQDAELSFLKVEFLYPGTENAKFNLALSLRGTGDYRGATALLEELIRENPEYHDYKVHLAETYYHAGNYAEAIAQFESLFLRFEQSQETAKQAVVARSLASVLFERGREQEARCYSVLAYRLIGGAPELVRHVKLLLATSQFELASALISEFSEAFPDFDDPQVWKAATLARIGEGKITEAAEFFDRAASKLTGTPDLEFIPIGFYLEANGIEGAAEAAQRAARGGGGGANDEDEEDSEDQTEILTLLNPALYLFWPPALVRFVTGEIAKLEEQ